MGSAVPVKAGEVEQEFRDNEAEAAQGDGSLVVEAESGDKGVDEETSEVEDARVEVSAKSAPTPGEGKSLENNSGIRCLCRRAQAWRRRRRRGGRSTRGDARLRLSCPCRPPAAVAPAGRHRPRSHQPGQSLKRRASPSANPARVLEAESSCMRTQGHPGHCRAPGSLGICRKEPFRSESVAMPLPADAPSLMALLLSGGAGQPTAPTAGQM